MQLSLFLFILMGPCSILTFRNYEYYFIKVEETWEKAKNHCKEYYTDLAVVRNENDMRKLRDSTEVQDEAWIGLYADGGKAGTDVNWKWSDGSDVTFTYWDENEEHPEKEECVVTDLTNEGKWKKKKCCDEQSFFCYDNKYKLIKENKTWEEALNYCRDHHHDLVTITNSDEQKRVKKKAEKASTDYVWLGLRYSCVLDLWFWVSDEAVRYDNWAPLGRYEHCDKSEAMESKGHNKWYSQSESNKFNFICSMH